MLKIYLPMFIALITFSGCTTTSNKSVKIIEPFYWDLLTPRAKEEMLTQCVIFDEWYGNHKHCTDFDMVRIEHAFQPVKQSS